MLAETEHKGMNTVMTHRVFGPHGEEALDTALAECARLEGLLSRYIPHSEIGLLNRAAGTAGVDVSPETYEILARARDFSRRFRGLFNITIGPVVDLWREARAAGEPAAEGRIRKALSLVNHDDLILDPARRTARLGKEGQSVDLGGIGKGYAGDRILEIFRRYGVTSAFTNLGGNVAALGEKPDGSPWQVGIRHPRRQDRLIGAVAVRDRSVVTSGDDQRFFVDGGGQRWHHILDPATGYPADAGLVSVTVVAKSGMDADALSTILFIAGLTRGTEMLRQYPGAEAVFVDADTRVYTTPGLKDQFQAAGGIDIEILS